MPIICKELGASFPTYDEMLKALKDNKEAIIKAKIETKTKSEPSGLAIVTTKEGGEATKDGEGLTPPDELKYGDTVYPVINTTNYLDSHGDVHLKGIWDDDLEEAKGNTYLVADHRLQVGKVIAYPKNVTPTVKEMKWAELGKDFEGTTEALIFETVLQKTSFPAGFDAYKNAEPVQHSVRMRYKSIHLAVDSKQDYFKEEKAVWDKYISEIANKDEAIRKGYFWAVEKASIQKEGSMVLGGSNDATPVLYSLKENTDIAGKEAGKNKIPDTLKAEINNLLDLANKF